LARPTGLGTWLVPQGSVLGLLLFLVYINDVTRVNFPTDCKLTVYADDMLLYTYMPVDKFELNPSKYK